MNAWDFPVEIKVTVDADIDRTLQSLNLKDSKLREVWFLEDNTPGLGTEIPPLLRAGVILRLRRDEKHDQSTVKLRPARKSQLLSAWQTAFEKGDDEYRIENDWAGSRQVLAASYVVDFPAGTFAAQLHDGDMSAAFTAEQLALVAQCTGLPLNIAGLTAFGPISARQWRDQDVGGLNVTVERWSVDALDFLEVSIRTDAEAEATRVRSELVDNLRTAGITLGDEQAPKTTSVLEYLMRR